MGTLLGLLDFDQACRNDLKQDMFGYKFSTYLQDNQ
jgi:hypothetical protein